MTKIQGWHLIKANGCTQPDNELEMQIEIGEVLTCQSNKIFVFKHGFRASTKLLETLTNSYAPQDGVVCWGEFGGDISSHFDNFNSRLFKPLWVLDIYDVLRDFAEELTGEILQEFTPRKLGSLAMRTAKHHAIEAFGGETAYGYGLKDEAYHERWKTVYMPAYQAIWNEMNEELEARIYEYRDALAPRIQTGMFADEWSGQ